MSRSRLLLRMMIAPTYYAVAALLICALGEICQAAPDLSAKQVECKLSLKSGYVSASAECGKDRNGNVAPMTFSCKEMFNVRPS